MNLKSLETIIQSTKNFGKKIKQNEFVGMQQLEFSRK